MKKTRKIKTKNNGVSTVDSETKSTQTQADSANAGNALESPEPEVESIAPDAGTPAPTDEPDNAHEQIAAIMSGFSSEPEIETIDPKLNEGFEKRTRKKREPNKKKAEPEKMALKVPGRLFLSVHSKLFTGVIGIVDGFRKNPMPEEYIQALGLSEADLNDPDLILLAEECVKAFKLENNPVAAFYGSLGALFLNNYMMLMSFIKQQNNANRAGTQHAPETKI